MGGATKGSKKGVNEWGKKTKKLKVKEHKLSGPVSLSLSRGTKSLALVERKISGKSSPPWKC